MIVKTKIGLIAGWAWMGLGGALLADDFSAQRAELEALAGLTTAPAMQQAEGFQSSENLKALYYDALDWKGEPTKVFAWMGLPEQGDSQVPGIVLVHGGGGTAFKQWVQLWNDHGFAAISIAVEGQTDKKNLAEKNASTPAGWAQHAWPGPMRQGIYNDSDQPFKDQWMVHAVADTVLANSLLRSLPEVDADNVGVMGISWGGVITSTVIGLDDRFAFAIPTYRCGDLARVENQYGRALGNNELYKQVLDPRVRLERATMPVLWFSWPEDSHFPMDQQAAGYRAMPGPVMVSLIPGMNHGHGAAWDLPDSYAFAKSVVEEGVPWCKMMQCHVEGGEIAPPMAGCTVLFKSVKPLDDAVLVFTTDIGVTGSRTWVESPAELKRDGEIWTASAALPAGTTAWFVNVHSGGLTVSSEFQLVQ